jgi:ATP-dependent Lhr-like helicase
VPAARIEEALEKLLQSRTILRGEFRPGGTEREWCDPDVLRQLRRRSLARLRREVEPVDQVVLARFLPAWQGVRAVSDSGATAPRGEAALERLAEIIDQLAGLPIPASVLERDVLPARIPGYQPRMLDELGAMGEVAWIGDGALGRDDGRIVLYRPGRQALLGVAGGVATGMAAGVAGADGGRPAPKGDLHGRLRDCLAGRGASFYRELAVAARGAPEREILDALWDLVWAGEITNDTFAPLRALRWRRPSGERRPRPGRLQMGPPEAAGRWSLVSGVGGPGPEATGSAAAAAAAVRAAAASALGPGPATARLHSLATVLLDRYGVLTREAVASEDVAGGFTAVYPILRAMEESGRIRRGYFVEGLGAAQFALAGAVDRLRSMREPADDRGGRTVHLLAAADPASPYGAALAWPRRDEADRRPFQRAAGAYVVLVDGAAPLYLERGGHSLQTLPAADDPAVAGAAFVALSALVDDGRVRELVIVRVDGLAVSTSPWRPLLEEAGFVAGYRGYVLRPAARRVVPAGRGLPPEAADEYLRRGGLRRSGPGRGSGGSGAAGSRF